MPWIEWKITDSLSPLEHDTMPFVAVDVQYDSVCYDTSGQGIGSRSSNIRNPEPVVRVVGKELEFNLPRAMQITMLFFSVDGRLISEPLSDRMEPGRHRIKIPDGIAGGVFIVQVNLGGRIFSAKLVRY